MWHFENEMKSIVEKQNPDMKSDDIERKLKVMWDKLSEEEQMPYYVKEAAYEEAWEVFRTEMEPVLIRNECSYSEITSKLWQMWRSLNEEERKPYEEKAIMLLTPVQVTRHLPIKLFLSWHIFCEEKGVTQNCGPYYHKICDMWHNLTEKEQNIYEEKSKVKQRERYKQREQLALKAINNAISTITKEQEKLKMESIEQMEKIKQKEQDIKEREAKLNEREKLINEKEARLIKMEEYLNNLFLL